jgi:hypothetical protein
VGGESPLKKHLKMKHHQCIIPSLTREGFQISKEEKKRVCAYESPQAER